MAQRSSTGCGSVSRLSRRLSIPLGVGLASVASGQSGTAVYEVTVETMWSLATHGSGYIASAHFSPLVGGVHSADVSFWEPGGIASDGIEAMAESGQTAALQAEMQAAIDAGTALSERRGPNIDPIETVQMTDWELTPNFDRITLVTMVAPSPDWFMGVHGFALRDENGDWIAEIAVPLEVYDSGTDSGTAFTSPNDDTQPQEPIRNIHQEQPFSGGAPLAVMTFRLISFDPCEADVNGDFELTPADFGAWVAAYNAQLPTADQNGDDLIDPADFGAWVANFNAGC